MMTGVLCSFVLVIFLCVFPVTALPNNHTDPSTNAVVDKGTFGNPSVNVRPKFRYWTPDASVDLDTVADDVQAAGDIGAAGLELLGYYLYGGPPSNGAGRGDSAPVDWATYGFGTPAWHSLVQAFAQAHKDNDLIMDFAIGPNQGTGVPAPEGSDGLAWDLVAFNVSTPAPGGSFNGTLPGWGTGTLQAAITGLAIKTEYLTNTLEPSLPGDLPMNRTQITLSEESLRDITNMVDEDGHVSVTFDAADANTTVGGGGGGGGVNNTIFAIYLIHSDYRAQDGPDDLGGPQTPAKSFVQNGSWAADHFSSQGAQTITKFWEEYVLINGTRELLMQVGNYGWEDSVEIEANVFWTRSFSVQFEKDHGYSINKWLPTLFHRNGHAKESNPPVWWVTDAPDAGESRTADYRETLAKQYHAYLTGLNEWAEEYLDIQFSAQVSYNMPMDMLANIPSVDAPECESLDFSDLIDGYRQYAGPANLARRRIVSSECGAVRGEAYAQLLPELMWHAKRSYAGGVNQFVFHGFPYSGNYGNTTWPVFTTFNYQYSNMHGPSDPGWEYYRDQIDFIARNNFILQTGVPKFDVAFWQKMTTYPGHIQLRTYQPTDLEEGGYTYEYLSPDNLDLPSAKVEDGILAPDAQGFKAMVVRANDSLTASGVERLVDFAHSGLPIVFSGGVPTTVLGTAMTGNSSLQSTAKQTLEELSSSLSNVLVTQSYDGLTTTLASMGIYPTTNVSSNGSWYTLWRRDDATDTDYFFVYNDAIDDRHGQGYTVGTIRFNNVTGTPYEYDAWTGKQEPIVTYTQDNESTTIPFTLAGSQSTIVAFHAGPSDNASHTGAGGHLTDVSSGILEVTTSSANSSNGGSGGGNIVLQVGPGPTQQTYTTSSGETKSVQPCSSSSLGLSNWTLVVEHWDPPSDMQISTGTQKHNTTHHLEKLGSWQEIDGLKNVSGRGYYNTTFTWPFSGSSVGSIGSATGAIIDFGFIVHTLRAWVNGVQLPPLDVTRPRADIKTLLVEGVNTVEVIVATPLGNVMRPIWFDLETSGTGPGSPGAGGALLPPVVDYGLVGDVMVVPYREEVVVF
ncbi:uncharacterized protein PV06_04207 [Exophiala oligosperma]|uniref:Glycosyl hydrolases family 2 sugar binding domain-containing protein n=1 Tax=Exophiala oligosperma TaxID=215243 RepID=A0A0D2DKZ2_9EURO|nr:uncharacterized protein PV06_04207 [Exophiala oligosperma]KIW43060.1 hypothetical protein PV06_04207 [Exophiala oligosperma]